MYFCLVIFCQGGAKLERARDLFEQVLEGCPAKFAKCRGAYSLIFLLFDVPCIIPCCKRKLHISCLENNLCSFTAFYLMYAKLEENHGLARHAMTIYERSTKAVLPEEQFEVSP